MNLLSFAWRESRGARARLLLFSSSIILGVAALVAVGSFTDNLREALELNARALLGADMLIRSRKAFGPEEDRFIGGIAGEQAREVSFSTMAAAPETGQSRLAQVRATAGAFPFYGELKTEPPAAAAAYQKPGVALVDKTLLFQLGIGIGETIKLGGADFRVAGTIEKIPGDSPLWESIAPRVFISLDAVPSTGLLRFGSLANHRVYIRTLAPLTREAIKMIEDEAKHLNLRVETIQDRKKAVERVSDNIHWYLRLSSFFALILGTLGMASGVRIYIGGKIGIAAILNTLGAKRSVPLRVFLVQVAGAGLLASMVGALLGTAVQYSFPYLFRRVLPAEVTLSLSWTSIALGVALGAVVAALVCYDALSRLRTFRPLEILRVGSPDALPAQGRELVRRVVIAALLFALSLTQAQNIKQAAVFFGCCLAALLLLTGAARLVKLGAGRFSRGRSFLVRQGYLNLNRANNQTLTLTLVIGFAVLFVTTTLFLRGMILSQIQLAGGDERPNMMFFDIQSEQLTGLQSFLAEKKLPALEPSPVVTMRMQSINGRPVREMLNDPAKTIPEWTLQREYRSTYRDRLWSSEEIIAGEFIPRHSGEGDVPVSLEDGLAEKLGIQTGAKIVFDVQGLEVRTVVASLRKVDWQRLQANFFVLFPAGVLDGAPQSFILGTRAGSASETAALQKESVTRFPNISILDLSTVLKIIDDVLGKFSVVVEFIGLCLIAVALIVLGSAVQGSFRARLREQALLKVLGAKRRQLLAITALEYLILGIVGALSGALLGLVASWLFGHFALKTEFNWQPAALVLPLVAAPLLTALVGLLGSFAAFSDKPFAVLRNE